jgi:hypothetical protein
MQNVRKSEIVIRLLQILKRCSIPYISAGALAGLASEYSTNCNRSKRYKDPVEVKTQVLGKVCNLSRAWTAEAEEEEEAESVVEVGLSPGIWKVDRRGMVENAEAGPIIRDHKLRLVDPIHTFSNAHSTEL